ncbi:hypothetical protein P3T36_004925 [Kitasatospora sp. MAP12-15]|uniref:hypothetical protein n=1 Tax=unclassified Kitasatospora TaxID=2633591 RepID=UPI0024764404|nr:hypothetical protein [Kitasatospora sp. MAP12-44]MDH6112098.1 hypothetical protein [Kitasatospora sp. MAP12-44]
MNAAPQPRSQQAEREELARLLPAAAEPELLPHRHHLLKDHLMTAVTDNSQPKPARRSLTLRLALPLGLAAAVAGVAFTALPGHPAPRSSTATHTGTATPVTPSSGAPQSLSPIVTAAYTLQSDPDLITLTIADAAGKGDLDGLQRDLDRIGVHSRVYAGDPQCPSASHTPSATPTGEGVPGPPGPTPSPLSSSDEAALNAAAAAEAQARLAQDGWDIEDSGSRGNVLSIRPSRFPADRLLFLYFPLAKTMPSKTFSDFQAGLLTGPAPACMPAETYFNPLASLYPTAAAAATPAATPTG